MKIQLLKMFLIHGIYKEYQVDQVVGGHFAVASMEVPIALGTDTGRNQLDNQHHFQEFLGLKPTYEGFQDMDYYHLDHLLIKLEF